MSRRAKIIWLGILGILLVTATIISQVGGNLAAELVREPLERACGEYYQLFLFAVLLVSALLLVVIPALGGGKSSTHDPVSQPKVIGKMIGPSVRVETTVSHPRHASCRLTLHSLGILHDRHLKASLSLTVVGSGYPVWLWHEGPLDVRKAIIRDNAGNIYRPNLSESDISLFPSIEWPAREDEGIHGSLNFEPPLAREAVRLTFHWPPFPSIDNIQAPVMLWTQAG